MKLALALLTKDKPELTRRSIEPLLQPEKFDLWWVDGSAKDSEGWRFPYEFTVLQDVCPKLTLNVRGGPDAAICYALTRMLAETEDNERGKDRLKYTHIGLIEQDVLLHPDWLGPTLGLFERGRAEGLEVGAVSARCYEDRTLVQRDGFALCHNLGSGQAIFTREAACLILDHYRTGWWTDNRLMFCQLSGVDIGQYACFRGNEQHTTADWHFDTILARHGLASLALTPSLATMLDQDIAAQGLKMADGHFDLLRNETAFAKFAGRTMEIRNGEWACPAAGRVLCQSGTYTYFPHQVAGIGGSRHGDWRLKWAQGFGPFVWESANQDREQVYPAAVEAPILGPCEFLVGGQGKVKVTDTHSGYTSTPDVASAGSGILQVSVPSGVSYRVVRLEALSPGVCFYGIRTREPQPWLTGYRFDHSQLPKVAE